MKFWLAPIQKFLEKPRGDGSWINGGFFVLEPDVLKMISSDETSFEDDILPKLAEIEQWEDKIQWPNEPANVCPSSGLVRSCYEIFGENVCFSPNNLFSIISFSK